MEIDILAKLYGRSIDADLKWSGVRCAPDLGLLRRHPKYPVADIDDHSGFFRDGNKIDGAYEAELWVVPAQQCFSLMDSPGFEFHDGLIVQLKLVASQRATQVAGQAHTDLCSFLQCMGEVAKAVPALILGRIHGLIGVPHQGFRTGAVMRVKRHADTG